MRRLHILAILGLISVAGCADPYPPTPKPDLTIGVMKTPNGMVAIPPACPDRVTAVTDPYDSQPMPQYGCADARNLAMMVENPADLVNPRALGPASGVTAAGSMFRYNNNQTRAFLYIEASPDYSVDATSMSTSTSAITGDLTGGLSGSSSSGGGSASGSTSGGASSVSAAVSSPQ